VQVNVHDCSITQGEMGINIEGGNLHLYNVSVGPEDIELGRYASTVQVHHRLAAKVTWNRVFPAVAEVNVSSAEGGTVHRMWTGPDGMVGPVMLRTFRLSGIESAPVLEDDRNLTLVAVADAIRSNPVDVLLDRERTVDLVLWDLVLPEIEVLAPRVDQFQNNTSLPVRGIASDVGSSLARVEVSHDSTTWWPVNGTETWSTVLEMEEGVYDIRARAIDRAGNERVVIVANVTIDLGPPKLTVIEPRPDQAQLSSDLMVRGTAVDPGSGIALVEVSLDGSSWEVAEGLTTWRVVMEVVDGVYEVTVRAWDRGGNWSMVTVSNVTVDTVMPVADAGPDVEIGQGEAVRFDASRSSDNIAIAGWYWTYDTDEGGTLNTTEGTFIVTYSLPGVYKATLQVVDRTGHIAFDQMVVTVLDTEPPVAAAGEDVTVDQHDEVVLDASGSTDNVGVASFTWTVEAGGSVEEHEGEEVTLTLHEVGEYSITLNVSDVEGNWAMDVMTVTVLDITPPVADGGEDTEVDQGTEVTFDGSASSDNVAVASWTWTFEEGGETVTLEGVAPSHAFENPGEYVVNLSVKDGAGNEAVTTLTVRVLDTEAPLVRVDHPTEVLVGEDLTLVASGSTDNVGIVEYKWVIVIHSGGEVRLTGPNVTHAFDSKGPVEVYLTVTDAAGNIGSHEFTVEVLKRDTGDGGDDLPLVAIVVVVALVIVAGVGTMVYLRRRA
jgi:PKD repeat protein